MVGEKAQTQNAQIAPDHSAESPRQHHGVESHADATQHASQWASWSNLWQIPTIAISAGLIAWGVLKANKSSSPADVKAVLAQTESLIATGQYKPAANNLRLVVEPKIANESIAVKARYHAIAGDLVFLSQHGEGVENVENFKQVAEHFESAVKSGAALTPRQIERWGESLLALGKIDAARERMAELEQTIAAAPLNNAEVEDVQRRLFRQIVEHELNQPEIQFNKLLSTITEYRSSREVDAPEELWAVARLAQLRLEAGQSEQAVNFLLVEMRRLEGRAGFAPSEFGELYALLGRGYFERGDYERAQRHLEHALTLFDSPAPSQGEALVLLGQIAASQGNPDTALERFQLVVNDYQATPSFLAGLLGLAESRSVIGDHESSLADYEVLRQKLEKSASVSRNVNPTRAAESLCDRHDASLAMGKLQQALRYVALAERLFPAEDVPGEVLYRMASTSRQIAENVLANEATFQMEAVLSAGSMPNPALRTEANASFERAGDYFVRHSNAQRTPADGDESWATSLWLAADSYDRAGRHDRAIHYFLNYIDRRPIDDHKRAETLFRIAQAYHAQLEYGKAIAYYEQVVADRARTTFAAQSYVPVARCYLAVDRRTEAIAQLRQVLSGDRLLKPDARDYRDALLELARVHYTGKEFNTAIELFTEALQRYPDDLQRLDMQFLLADSYRSAAMALAERMTGEPIISSTETVRLKSAEHDYLQNALDGFARVCEGYGQRALEQLGSAEQDQFRRARLYRADCAYHLGHYHQAVDLYDQVTRQYSAHHSSMYALIQIVNCYRAMGDDERTEAAHRRALARLRQLPETAFATPDALMDRAAWERWLEFMPVNPSPTAAANAPTG